jgi:hypothetical protein
MGYAWPWADQRGARAGCAPLFLPKVPFFWPKGPGFGAHTGDWWTRTPELSLRSRIPWTERQKYRCVHGFREPNVGSCHCVHGFRELLLHSNHAVRVTNSDAMKSRRGTCHGAPFMEVLYIDI